MPALSCNLTCIVLTNAVPAAVTTLAKYLPMACHAPCYLNTTSRFAVLPPPSKLATQW